MKRKTAQNGEGLVSFIMWVTSGDQPQKQCTGSFIQVHYRSSGHKTLAWSKLLTFTGKKLTFGVYSLHFWISSTPRPLMWWMRPGLPCFSLSSALYIILNANRTTKNRGGLGMRLIVFPFKGCGKTLYSIFSDVIFNPRVLQYFRISKTTSALACLVSLMIWHSCYHA